MKNGMPEILFNANDWQVPLQLVNVRALSRDTTLFRHDCFGIAGAGNVGTTIQGNLVDNVHFVSKISPIEINRPVTSDCHVESELDDHSVPGFAASGEIFLP